MPNPVAAYGRVLDRRATRVANELFPVGTKFQGRGTHVTVASHDVNRGTSGKRDIYTHLVGPEGKPAGFARVKATPTRKVKVSLLQLAPEYRRQGLGGAMLNEFATKARSSKDIRRVNWLSAIEGSRAWRKPGSGVRYQRGIAYALSPRTSHGLDRQARREVNRHKILATAGLTKPSSTIKLSRGAREELDRSLWMATARGGRRGGGMHPAVRGAAVVGVAAGGTGVVVHHNQNQVEKGMFYHGTGENAWRLIRRSGHLRGGLSAKGVYLTEDAGEANIFADRKKPGGRLLFIRGEDSWKRPQIRSTAYSPEPVPISRVVHSQRSSESSIDRWQKKHGYTHLGPGHDPKIMASIQRSQEKLRRIRAEDRANKVKKSDAPIPASVRSDIEAKFPEHERAFRMAEVQGYYNQERDIRRTEQREAMEPNISEPKQPEQTPGQAYKTALHQNKKKRRRRRAKVRKWPASSPAKVGPPNRDMERGMWQRHLDAVAYADKRDREREQRVIGKAAGIPSGLRRAVRAGDPVFVKDPALQQRIYAAQHGRWAAKSKAQADASYRQAGRNEELADKYKLTGRVIRPVADVVEWGNRIPLVGRLTKPYGRHLRSQQDELFIESARRQLEADRGFKAGAKSDVNSGLHQGRGAVARRHGQTLEAMREAVRLPSVPSSPGFMRQRGARTF